MKTKIVRSFIAGIMLCFSVVAMGQTRFAEFVTSDTLITKFYEVKVHRTIFKKSFHATLHSVDKEWRITDESGADVYFISMLQVSDYLYARGFSLAQVYATYRKNVGSTEHWIFSKEIKCTNR
jgi:hypothetical protein